MPYKSDAQRRFFHAAEARGDISKKTVNEWDSASKGKKLPEHKEKKTVADLDLDEGTEDGAIDNKGKHKMHGKDGSHQESHKMIGGARSRIHTGSPEELEAFKEEK